MAEVKEQLAELQGQLAALQAMLSKRMFLSLFLRIFSKTIEPPL